MTLLEVVIVVVIMAIGASGLSFSLGALARTNLKAGAAKLASAARYSYNRAIVQGTTVRIAFDLPSNAFSIQEAHGRVVLARGDGFRRVHGVEEDERQSGGVDPWAAAQNRIDEALQPSLGASPFGPLQGKSGDMKRFTNVNLGRRVQIVRLIVPHEPEPREDGRGAIYFFPGGYGEHAVIHVSDGGDGEYSVEVHPLTGRCTIHPEAYEPRELLDDPENPDFTEVEE